MRFSPMLVQLSTGANIALLVIILAQAGTAQASGRPMPAFCDGTATAVACAHREPGLGRFDVSLTGPSGTKALFGVCPASTPQTIDLRPPFTVESHDNRSRCQIALVDSHGMRHRVPFSTGVFHPGLITVQIIIYPVDSASIRRAADPPRAPG